MSKTKTTSSLDSRDLIGYIGLNKARQIRAAAMICSSRGRFRISVCTKKRLLYALRISSHRKVDEIVSLVLWRLRRCMNTITGSVRRKNRVVRLPKINVDTSPGEGTLEPGLRMERACWSERIRLSDRGRTPRSPGSRPGAACRTPRQPEAPESP